MKKNYIFLEAFLCKKKERKNKSKISFLLIVMTIIPVLLFGQGANTPFKSIEGEAGVIAGGATIRTMTNLPTGPTPELEASGRSFVELSTEGSSVSLTNTTGITSNTLVVRGSIPDSPSGGGIDATLNLYVDGVFRQAINFTSRYSWQYGVPLHWNDNDPASGTPHRFYDETRCFVVGDPISPGSIITLKKDGDNTAAFYYIDMIDLENVGSPKSQPANTLSVTDFGAIADDDGDDTNPFIACINACQSQNKGMWIPSGLFRTGTQITATGIDIYGAGMWYTTLYRIIGGRHSWSLLDCNIKDLYIFNPETSRELASGHDYGILMRGSNWLIDRVWIHGGGACFWVSGTDGTIQNCRTSNSWADGLNINNGPNVDPTKRGYRLTCQNNYFRGSTDDGIAINAQNGGGTEWNMVDTKVINNSSIATIYANGIRIAGGRNSLVENNLITDPADLSGITVAEFGTDGNPCESALVKNNTFLRCGGYRQAGAVYIGDEAHATIEGNQIIDAVTHGITMRNCTAILNENSITHPALQGIYVFAGAIGSAQITGNEVTQQTEGEKPFLNNSPATFLVTLDENNWTEEDVLDLPNFTFNNYYTGDPLNGIKDYDATGIYYAEGSAPNTLKVNGSPVMIAADHTGNIAIGYMGGGKILRKFGSKVLGYNTGAGNHAIAIDPNDEFIYHATYQGSTASINSSIWKNNGETTSIGYNIDSDPPVGSLNVVKIIPFLSQNDEIYYNGAVGSVSNRTPFTFGTIKGLTFDASGNLYFADISNQTISKISILRYAIAQEAETGTNQLTLSSVAGVKRGDLVSGINIPSSCYVGNITGNTITLVAADDVSSKNLLGKITPSNSISIAFITGITKIAGTGIAGKAVLPNTAENTALHFTTSINDKTVVGLAFDQEGNFLISDQLNKRVLKIEGTGTPATISSNSTVSELASSTSFSNGIAGIAIDPNGQGFYLADKGNRQLHLISNNGSIRQLVTGGILELNNYSINGMTVTLGNSPLNDLNMPRLKVGMYLKGNGIVQGCKIVSIGINTFETSLNTNGITPSGNITLSVEDGFTSTSDSRGFLDGPVGIAIAKKSNNQFDIALTEGSGMFTKILSGGSTLPVTMSEYTAKASGAIVLLNWTTVSEHQNNFFTIEKSVDGKNFSLLKTVPSKAPEGALYSLQDQNPQHGYNYYRLIQTDFDGHKTSLGIREAYIGLNSLSNEKIYPNPLRTNIFYVDLPKNTSPNINILISDISGRKVYQGTLVKNIANHYQISLDRKLVSGIYLITINNKSTQRLLVGE